ncbi:MAG: protein-L-isoaspartate(D-aspartate) O-methyltransferase [candidate division Zixibacteria bacterium]|nr:protein-L-isoaspartate(D-aspartate) O-methyltransferase [candidate division Zixibacteria bacterium]
MFKNKNKLDDADFVSHRTRMVEQQLVTRGIKDARVLAAMRSVPRHLFVPEAYRAEAYYDCPQPIGYGQTISQPFIVASMTAELELEEKERVLEIGTGCGYQTAVLAEIAADIYSIEIIPELSQKATGLLKTLGYRSIHTLVADGSLGWPEQAPFDAIIVTAAALKEPATLMNQLAVGGRMVYPLDLGRFSCQQLLKIRRTDKGFDRQYLYDVRFVPMQGRAGD